jgi:hypothetical protein
MANRQEIVCTYIYENYVASGRLRHDVVSNKVQIAVMGDGLQVTGWRDIAMSAAENKGREDGSYMNVP